MNEADRIAALRRHNILDTKPEPTFDRIVAYVRDVCRVPMSLVSLVDTDRQWFKAKVGVSVDETPLDTSVCALAIQQTGMFQIEDLSLDPRTAGMSLVAQEPAIRFYAGVPLIGSDGAALGSLCAIDTVARPGGLSEEQQRTLTVMAEQVIAVIEMRTAISQRDAALASDEASLRAQVLEARYRAIVDAAIDSAIISFDSAHRVTSWSKGAERLFGWLADEMIGQRADRIFIPQDRAAGVPEAEFETARMTGRAADNRWHMRKDSSRFYAHGAMTPLNAHVDEGYVKALRDITEEHETREALVSSQEKLQLATRAAGLGQFDFWPQTGLLEWDDRCRELFGLSPGVPVSYEGAYVAGLHPDDRERGTSGVSAALEPDGSRVFDLEYRTIGIEDGVERHIHAKGSALFENGVAQRLIGTVQDVTAERKARLALHETEERLRLAGRATNDAIWDWDLIRDHVTWNDAVTQAYGHPLDAIAPTGAWWIGHIHPDDREHVRDSIHAVIDSCATDWMGEYRFLRADGSYAYVRDRGFVLRDDAGKPMRMIGAMFDQTEHKAVEHALRNQAHGLAEQVEQSQGEIERLWSTSPDLLAICDDDGYMREVNPAWTTLLGYDEQDLVGHYMLDFIEADDHPVTLDAHYHVVGGGQPQVVNRYRHKDGSLHTISWVAAKSGDMIYATGRDITAEVEAREVLRQTEEALRQAQKVEAVGQLTGGVAHDFNNLLTVIKGSVELLKRPDLAPERQARYIEAIADTTERATRLTSQLLAFARRSALQPQVLDACRSVEALTPMLSTLCGSRVDFRLSLATETAWVCVDPSQFDTAIVNLAANARDAMEGEGTIDVRVAHVPAMPAIRGHAAVDGPHVAIIISDSGSGIAGDDFEQIFQPFFTTKSVGHGTGLGLSQVIGFAKQSHGEIGVESLLGQGSTFTLYLPAVPAPQVVADQDAPARMSVRSGACVLVVEDNPEVGEFATQALAELGYRSHWVHNAEEAIKALAREPERFDVVFTDVVMPGRSGVELATEVRERDPALPVVLTSGYSQVLAEQGSMGYPLLRKPYSIEDLSNVLQNVSQQDGT